MTRLTLPADAEMSPEARAACEEVRAGPRGKVPAPMIAWLRNPELARRGQKVGELLRFETTLEPALTEIAILLCARHWTSHHEWTAHRRLALAAGVDPAIIAEIAARRRPRLGDARGEAVVEVASTLLAEGHLPQPLYERTLDALGERGLVELVATIGYYCMVSLTLNAFEIGLPNGFAPELVEPDADERAG